MRIPCTVARDRASCVVHREALATHYAINFPASVTYAGEYFIRGRKKTGKPRRVWDRHHFLTISEPRIYGSNSPPVVPPNSWAIFPINAHRPDLES